jgi:hypothetical protein
MQGIHIPTVQCCWTEDWLACWVAGQINLSAEANCGTLEMNIKMGFDISMELRSKLRLGMSQVVECLPGKHEALSSKLHTAKKKISIK